MCELLKDTDELIDLAYATVPKTSFDDPVNDVLSNLPAGVGLAQEASKANLKKIIFVSSGGTVYGVPQGSSYSGGPSNKSYISVRHYETDP